MKKVLLSTAAVAGLAMIATPAAAQVKLELGGYFKGYGIYADVDEASNAAGTESLENRDLDIIRNTEVHFGGETTLDNGLTVGAHLEVEADRNGTNDSFNTDESYVYFSGGWGRVNFGSEDGAAYLLQVAAPSADSNIDGIRQYVNPVNYAATTFRGLGPTTGGSVLELLDARGARSGLDYDQDISSKSDKLSYLSPIMNGFQLGLSYAPEIGDDSDEDSENFDDQENDLGEVYDIALRYEGQFNNVGVIFGAGYTHAELEEQAATQVALTPATQAAGTATLTDDRTSWNVGLDLDIGPFGIGAIYMEDDYGEIASAVTGGVATDTLSEEETWVVGVDYTTGPFKLGASYMDVENTSAIAGFSSTATAAGIDSQRYTGGVTYTYGPGMTFRGSISHVEHENVRLETASTAATDVEATTFTLGTQINF